MTQESMTDTDGAKVTAKKEAKKSSNADENKVDEKIYPEKPCNVTIYMSTSVYLRHIDNLTSGKDGGTGKGGVLVMQERMVDSDADKVDANAKADAPNASGASKIKTTKIDVKRGILKTCAIAIALS